MPEPDLVTLGLVLTDLHAKLRPLWLFHELASRDVERMEALAWHDPALDRRENKQRMKELGGAVALQRQALGELVVLSLGKTMEAVTRHLQERTGRRFRWEDLDEASVPFLDDARVMWATYNVVKHHDGIVPDPSNRNGRVLVEVAGLAVGDQVPGHDLDARAAIFAVHEFLLSLAASWSHVPLPGAGDPREERRARFEEAMVPEVVRRGLLGGGEGA